MSNPFYQRYLKMTIEFGGTEKIDLYKEINNQFLKSMFDLDATEVMVTDLSTLSDFNTRVMTGKNTELSNFDDYYSIAEEKLLKLVKAKYNLILEKGVYTKLVDIYKILAKGK